MKIRKLWIYNLDLDCIYDAFANRIFPENFRIANAIQAHKKTNQLIRKVRKEQSASCPYCQKYLSG